MNDYRRMRFTTPSIAILASFLLACGSPKPLAPDASPLPPAPAPTPAPAPAPEPTPTPTPTPAPEPAPEPAPTGLSIPKRYDLGGAATGALEARAAAVAWPGDEASLAHFSRKTATGEAVALGLDDGYTKRLAWGIGGTAGLIYLKHAEGGLAGYWALTDGDDRAGAQQATRPQREGLEGSYRVEGQNRDAATWYSGELVITKAGERYDLAWTIGAARFAGVGLEDDGGLFACWSEGAKACAVAVYVPEEGAAGRWSGRVAVSGEAGVVKETLVAGADGGRVSLTAPARTGSAPAAPECLARCRDEGLCDYGVMDGCTVRDDAACSRARSCPGRSGCVIADGRCMTAAAAAAQCKESKFDGLLRGCAEEGECTLHEGLCVVGSDSDCAASEACTFDGRCHAKEGVCVAAGDSDCAGAKACTGDKRCTAKDGACWVAAEGPDACRDACARRGECAASDGVCRPAVGADCERSEACRDLGRCDLDKAGSPCATSDEGCLGATVCKDKRACTSLAGRCREVNQEWCTALCSTGDGSAQLGLCTASGGRCVNPEDEK